MTGMAVDTHTQTHSVDQ